MLSRFTPPLAALFLLSVASLASAEVDAAKVAEAGRATNAFLALTEGSSTSGEAPRENDPAVSALFDKIYNLSALGTTTPTLDEVQQVSSLMENGTRVLMSYMLVGTGQADINALSADATAMQKAEQNMLDYAAEIGRSYDFTAQVQGVLAETVADFSETASAEQKAGMAAGLDQMRGGVVQTFGGILQGVGSTDYELGWRQARAAVLADVGPKLARVLEEEQSVALGEQARSVAASAGDPALAADLESFAAALEAQ